MYYRTIVHSRTKVVVLALLLAVLAVACGDDDEPALQAPDGASHNAADVAFAQGMIPHHEQAIEMSDLALARAADPKVKDLATRIKAAQGPEIEKMKGWLAGWGQPYTAGGAGQGHAHQGMLSPDEMARLGAASGPEFDRLFLEGMIRHHEGAVTMSEEELGKGMSSEAKALARQIIDSQRAEIDEMRGLLGGAPAGGAPSTGTSQQPGQMPHHDDPGGTPHH